MKNPLQLLRDKHYRNAPMVKYWKTQESVEAKQMRMPDGSYAMKMQGEDYLFPGYPRGALLYGGLSKLKHEIKNQIFNDAWAMLEKGDSAEMVREYLKREAWPKLFELADKARYDMVPYERMNPPIKELYRAMTIVENGDKAMAVWKEVVCFILQEDDAYRMRMQWMVKFFPWWGKPTMKDFTKAMEMAEEAEVVGDMKERQRLFRRVFTLMVGSSDYFERLLKEVDWKRLRLNDADKYFFRAKYFKVDYPEYQY